MSKFFQLLIFSVLLSTLMYAIDLNTTEEIINNATQATQEIQEEIEKAIQTEIVSEKETPLIENTIITTTEPIEEESVTEIKTTEEIISEPVAKPVPFRQGTIVEIITQEPLIEENLSTPSLIETIDSNSTETIPSPNNNQESVKEKTSKEKGDVLTGKKIFKYVLKEDCKLTAYKIAEKHSQEEWEELREHHKFKETLFETCPNVRIYYQDRWTKDLFQFIYESSDEDDIPEC